MPSRRSLLAGVAGLGCVLAGCSGSQGDGRSPIDRWVPATLPVDAGGAVYRFDYRDLVDRSALPDATVEGIERRRRQGAPGLASADPSGSDSEVAGSVTAPGLSVATGSLDREAVGDRLRAAGYLETGRYRGTRLYATDGPADMGAGGRDREGGDRDDGGSDDDPSGSIPSFVSVGPEAVVAGTPTGDLSGQRIVRSAIDCERDRDPPPVTDDETVARVMDVDVDVDARALSTTGQFDADCSSVAVGPDRVAIRWLFANSDGDGGDLAEEDRETVRSALVEGPPFGRYDPSLSATDGLVRFAASVPTGEFERSMLLALLVRS